MAIFDDDFQGYSVGTLFPTGSWVAFGGFNPFTREIKSDPEGTGIPGTDRYLEIFLGGLEPDPAITGYHAAFTLHGSLKLLGELPFGGGSYEFANGPNAGGFTFGIFGVKVEADASISVRDGTNTLLANSGAAGHLFKFHSWNFIQIGCSLSDDLVLGVLYVKITLTVFLNGEKIIDFATTTGIQVAQLKNGTSEVNHFVLDGGHHGAYTLDSGKDGTATYPHAGSPHARVNQGAIELAALPSSGKIDVNQGAIELATLPDSTSVRVPQGVIELILQARNRWYISES